MVLYHMLTRRPPSCCDVRIDFERACLNFGLYLSYQDDFQGAVDILERIQSNATDLITGGSETRSPERQRVNDDAHRLLLYCRKQLIGISL